MKTQLINFTIPKKLLKDLDLLAKRQEKSRSEILREATRILTTRAKQRERNFATIKRSAKRVGMSEDAAIKLIDETREKLQINR